MINNNSLIDRYDEDLVPVYDSEQIEIWGLPDWYGVTQYRVIALRETESPMVSDWKMELERPMVSTNCRAERIAGVRAVINKSERVQTSFCRGLYIGTREWKGLQVC